MALESNVFISWYFNSPSPCKSFFNYLLPFQCFLCGTRPEFEQFCSWSRENFVDIDGQPVFEIMDTRPVFATAEAASDDQDFEYETVKHLNEDGTESNDEFEIIGWSSYARGNRERPNIFGKAIVFKSKDSFWSPAVVMWRASFKGKDTVPGSS